MKDRDIYWRRYKIQETQDNDASVPFKVGTLGPHTVLLITISSPIIFSWISSMVWNLFPFKGNFSLGESQKYRAPNLGCRGAESPGWFGVSPKTSAQGMMLDWACCCDEAADHQLVTAAVFWIIWIVSAEECSGLTRNLMQILCSSHSLILNVMITVHRPT